MVRRAFAMPPRKPRSARSGTVPVNRNGSKNIPDTPVPSHKFSGVLKVVQKGPEDEATTKPRTIATLKMADVEKSTLGDIRKILNLSAQDGISFCYGDYSPAPDGLLLFDYLGHENENVDLSYHAENGIKTSIVPCVLFVAPPPEPTAPPATKEVNSASAISNGGSFAVMAYELVEGDEPKSRGALESRSLGASDPTKLTLAGMRKLLASATRMSTKHKFCTPSGVPAIDESMTFSAYLRLEAAEADEKAEIPSVKVYYKLNKPRTDRRPFRELDQMEGKVEKSDYALTGQELDGGKTVDRFDANRDRTSEIDIQPTMRGSSTNPYAVGAGYLTEGEWTEVMRNCGIMYGWIIDTENNRIVRAPKPAFRLRIKQSPEFQIPAVVQEEQRQDSQPDAAQAADISQLQTTKLRVQELRNKVGNWSDPSRLSSGRDSRPSSLMAGTTSPEERLKFGTPGDSVLSSKEPTSTANAVKDGVRVEGIDGQPSGSTSDEDSASSETATEQDSENNISETPPVHQEVQTTEKSDDGNAQPPVEHSTTQQGTDEPEKATHPSQATPPAPQQPIIQIINNNNLEPEKKASDPEPAPAEEDEPQQVLTSWTPPQFMRRAVQEISCVLPSFQVNDDSRIDVTVSSHEFETSMARNDFSSTSTEGSMSGGYGGFAASVSAGKESQKSSGFKSTDNKYERTMIAKYMIPRADIYLHPDDLEPTPELQEAIERIRNKKDVADLRKLQRDFGQLWCQRVTVGGRLQSTRIMSQDSKTTEHEEKEAFKWSVGAQVTTPWVSASVKHTEAGGKSAADTTTDVIKKEKNIFEAVGGDTILVSNPELWAASVADFRTWRVIDRGSLSSLVDALSSIEGYAPVRSWFMQALPTLSKYIELPPSREVTVRLKVDSPKTQLSLSYLKQGQNGTNGKQQMDPFYYFGHTDDCLVRPVENSVNLQVNFWSQMDMDDAKPLFSPQQYRAPVLRGFQGSQALTDADFTNTLWTISAPFDDALHHESLVVIQTVPAARKVSPPPATPPAPSPATEPAPNNDVKSRELSLGVFRNQQGVFLPCLTDASASGQQFWRILKRDLPISSTNSAGEKQKPFIRQGDELGLAWYLEDQTAGFRDFEDDVFGRRRFSTTVDSVAEPAKNLFLKLPWPRFEGLQPAKMTEKDPVTAPLSNSMVMSGELPAVTTPAGTKDATSAKGIPKFTRLRTLPGMMRARDHESRKGEKISDESVFAVQDVTFRIDVVSGVGGGSSRRGDLEDGLTPESDGKDNGTNDPGAIVLSALEGLMFLKGVR